MFEDVCDDWHIDAERKVTARMEKLRVKHGYEKIDTGIKPDEDDLERILEGKERDLVLAAELGKSLLAKNEELNKQNKTIARECLEKLQVIILLCLKYFISLVHALLQILTHL